MAGSDTYVVVVGGANIDVKARSTRPAVAHSSNPGVLTQSPGGVARNIAENLARLGTATHLVSAVGDDPFGELVLARTVAAGVQVEHVTRAAERTGSYSAILDSDGELMVAIADMAAVELVTPEVVARARDLIRGAALLVLEGNLSPEAIATAIDLAKEVPVLFDPVSAPKAERSKVLFDGVRRWHLVTPDLAELAGLLGAAAVDPERPEPACARLHALGVTWVWAREGGHGSYLSGPDGGTALPALPSVVLDVTGAGDAMLAAWCHGVLTGLTPREAARLGHAAAAITIQSVHTVRPDLTADLLRRTLEAAPA